EGGGGIGGAEHRDSPGKRAAGGDPGYRGAPPPPRPSPAGQFAAWLRTAAGRLHPAAGPPPQAPHARRGCRCAPWPLAPRTSPLCCCCQAVVPGLVRRWGFRGRVRVPWGPSSRPSMPSPRRTSRSFVLAALRALIAVPSCHGSPLGTLRALVLRGLNGDGVPRGWPGRPDAHEGVVPVRTVYQHGAAPPRGLAGPGRLFLVPAAEGGDVLGIGIDWAEEFHLVALGRPAEGVIEVVRAGHHPKAVAALVARIAGLEPDPAEVRVVIETRHGLLAGALAGAGYTVLPVNPELVSRRRGPARKKRRRRRRPD